MKILSHVVCVVGFIGIGIGVAEPSTTRCVNIAYGYAFVVPSGWHVDQEPVPYIYNFPPDEAGPQGQIPEGGAVILIIPSEKFVGKYVKTIEDWIQWNTRIKQRNIRRQDIPCRSSELKRSHICVEVRSTFQLTPEDPALEDVSYYFTLGSKYFRGFLEYHEGDKDAESYVSVLSSIIDSIRTH